MSNTLIMININNGIKDKLINRCFTEPWLGNCILFEIDSYDYTKVYLIFQSDEPGIEGGYVKISGDGDESITYIDSKTAKKISEYEDNL